MEHAVKAAGFPDAKAAEFIEVAQARCNRGQCSGLEPCDFCRDVRIGFVLGLFRVAGLTKKQMEDFNAAYAEAFDGAVAAIRKMRDDLTAQRVAEKEALEKKENATSAPSHRKKVPTAAPAPRGASVEKNGTTPQTSKPEENPPASSSHNQE